MIEINGKEVYQQHNTKPQDFKDVQMWISDTFYDAAKCIVKNIRFENLGMCQGRRRAFFTRYGSIPL